MTKMWNPGIDPGSYAAAVAGIAQPVAAIRLSE